MRWSSSGDEEATLFDEIDRDGLSLVQQPQISLRLSRP